MTDTVLDQAHAAMQAAPADDTLRLRFFERLGDSELFLMLDAEADGDTISPQVFNPGSGEIVLAFDREARLAEFAGGASPYAALSGRSLVSLLAPQGLGLGLNLDVAPSAFLLDATGVAWLAQTLTNTPDEVEADLAEVTAPRGLPDALLTALDAKLAMATGLAQLAYLVGTRDAEGRRGHMLGFVGAMPGAEGALAQAAGEALTFSGIEAGAMDVGFFDAADAVVGRLAQVGLRFDLPQPAPASTPRAPGMDPDAPPRLR